jgi:hypothetical protein
MKRSPLPLKEADDDIHEEDPGCSEQGTNAPCEGVGGIGLHAVSPAGEFSHHGWSGVKQLL